ncbi:MAG: Threonine--tRNA ligase [Chlamydiae bacterium]|nr:Threonine--tRNA ligase [Chlamydiota bacterium]
MLANTAAEVLARAAHIYFPHSHFLGAGSDRLGFYADFALESPFEEVFLPRIMDQMKMLLKGEEPFRVLQMSAHHARRYLQKAGFPGGTKGLEKLPASVTLSLFEWMGVAGVSEGPFCDYPEELRHFALLDWTDLGDGVVRIHGAIFEKMRQLSDFLKKWRSHGVKGHESLGKKGDLFSSLPQGRWLWHPRGFARLKALEAFWQSQVESEGFDLFTGGTGREAFKMVSGPLATFERISSSAEVGPHLGLFSSENPLSDRLYIKSSKEELSQNCISLLKFIGKFHTLLGFEYQWVMSLPRAGGRFPKALIKLQRDALKDAVEPKGFTEEIATNGKANLGGFVSDRLGRLWESPCVSIETIEDDFLIEGSVFGRLEWVVALSMEKDMIEMRQEKS